MITRIFIIVFCCLVTSCAYAQLDSNKTFELSKGKWRMPLDNVTNIFLPNKFASGLMITSIPFYGIVFITNKPSEVYSVAEGKVISIFSIGEIKAVIIKYGDYYLIYSELEECYVNKNDLVFTNSKIGRLRKKFDDKYELEFLAYFKSKEIESIEDWFNPDLKKYYTAKQNKLMKKAESHQ
ncbi:M23 family metallopeptidase [Flavihumibacter sp. RY-1]|uniref:M23 family metallopeptidase n=1 Tax=Flavihumibacter fluminis TaxID=2909236 RepID=A0ABS9BJN0_9BACT|nr:M23 family metallopeptidase [Flavihumibacter fluminis]MCF1715044.1 M23 family metallopeptidase [Flavihumibacter fluminis]